MPLVSVVITTFRRPDRLPSAIKTVTEQTFKDLEIIVVDGANTEEAKSVVEMYQRNDNRIKYIQVEPEAVDMFSMFGVQHSRNVGCKASKGEYIAMLDDDDSWAPTKIEKQLNAFNKYKGIERIFEEFDDQMKIGLVICYSENIGPKESVLDKPKNRPTYEDLLKSFNLSSTSTFLIRKDVLEEIGYWNENLRGMHEYDIALKIAKKGFWVITVPEILMTRHRSFFMEGRYYYIKIAEVFDFWRYYGKESLMNLSIKDFTISVAKTVSLFFIYSFGFILKEKVWKVIYPLKEMYQRSALL